MRSPSHASAPYPSPDGFRFAQPILRKRVAAVLQPREAALLIKLAEASQDLAAVAGAEPCHQFEKGGGALRQRRFQRLIRARCGSWGACGTVNSTLSALPNGLVQSEAALGAGAGCPAVTLLRRRRGRSERRGRRTRPAAPASRRNGAGGTCRCRPRLCAAFQPTIFVLVP